MLIFWGLLASAVLLLGLAIGCCLRWPRASLAAFCTIALTGFAGWQYMLREYRLGHVPDAFHTRRILYAKEESWGFGPGGNETGIIVYRLPDDIAGILARQGPGFFSPLSENYEKQMKDGQGEYGGWKATPIEDSDVWQTSTASGRHDIDDYTCRYGFCIDIDQNIAGEVDAIVNAPGSYYAYGHTGGIILVAPSRGKIVYLYSG